MNIEFSSVHLFHFQHINIVNRIYQAGNQYKHNYNTEIMMLKMEGNAKTHTPPPPPIRALTSFQ